MAKKKGFIPMDNSDFLMIIEKIDGLRVEITREFKELKEDTIIKIGKLQGGQESCKKECALRIKEIDERIFPIETKIRNVELRKKGFKEYYKPVIIGSLIAIIGSNYKVIWIAFKAWVKTFF